MNKLSQIFRSEKISRLFIFPRLREAVHRARSHQRRRGQLRPHGGRQPRILSQICSATLHVHRLVAQEMIISSLGQSLILIDRMSTF